MPATPASATARACRRTIFVAALGEVDELNCVLEVGARRRGPEEERGTLLQVQHDLLDLGGELSIPGHSLLKASAWSFSTAQLRRSTARSHP